MRYWDTSTLAKLYFSEPDSNLCYTPDSQSRKEVSELQVGSKLR
ncbi:MAG: hypothetical protein JWQ04_3347 [Pedosphaera sp.]|nr:hypothetical protein [Pedosphaera sp.]